MRIELRKINTSKYNDLINSIRNNIDFYKDYTKNTIKIDDNIFTIEELSDPLNSNEKIEIDIGEEDIYFSSSMMKWKENFLVGKLLHKKLLSYENQFRGIFYEPEFWAYICIQPLFRKYIFNRYFSNDNYEDADEENENTDNNKTEKEKQIERIQRYFLQKGKITRNGIMFNWMITDCLYDNKKQYELSEVAFSFIDSVKGIYERSFHKNKYIVKAFVQGIINNGKSNGFKDSKYRSIIPTHISNIAALNSLDSYDVYYELVNKISFEQKKILILYNKEKNINSN